jgi:hypothetical protein
MRSILLALVGLLLLATIPASAAVVTVTPDPQWTDTPVGERELGETTLTNGWSIVTNAKGWGKLSTFGPALYQARNQEGNTPIVAGDPQVNPNQSLGRGTFYATCDMWIGGGIALPPDNPDAPYWKTPSTVWLGTDTWNGESVVGKTLSSITAMEYYSFVDKCPTKFTSLKSEQGWWGKSSWWGSVQQPIQLQLTVLSPDDSEMRQLWHRPWGGNFVGDDGLGEPGSKKGRWQRFNCMTAGKWYIPSNGTSPNTLEYGFDDQGGNAWSKVLSFSFPEGTYGPLSGWKLATTGKSPGWKGNSIPPGSINSNGTGKPINFFVGARTNGVSQQKDSNGNIIACGFLLQYNPPPPAIDPTTNKPYKPLTVSWYNHAFGTRAQIDYFTLGFNGVSETYDFEPALSDPPVRTVALTEKSLKDVLAGTLGTKTNFLFKITGQVAPSPTNQNLGFVIEDGTKLTYNDPGYSPDYINTIMPGPVRIFLPDDDPAFNQDPLWIGPGDIVSVVGMVEPLRFSGGPSDLMVMWTNINKLTKHQNY